MTVPLKTAVVVTLINEEGSIQDFIASILAQTYRPDEFIIVDGGSTDQTVALIEEFVTSGSPIRLLVQPGNRSVGRNTGIEYSSSEIIASTDAGSVLDRDWLQEITAPFLDDNGPDVVGGVTLPLVDTLFEACVAVINLPEIDEIDPTTFMPSSRSAAFRKSAWRSIGGYPQAFDWNEDTVFDLSLAKAGFRFVFAPSAIVRWRPPGSFGRLFRQFMNYARGDGQAGIYFREFYWPQKYLIYITLAILLFGNICSSWFLPVALGLAVWYWHKPVAKALNRTGRIETLFLMPLIMVVRDVAEMIGFFFGVLERWQHPERFHWRR